MYLYFYSLPKCLLLVVKNKMTGNWGELDFWLKCFCKLLELLLSVTEFWIMIVTYNWQFWKGEKCSSYIVPPTLCSMKTSNSLYLYTYLLSWKKITIRYKNKLLSTLLHAVYLESYIYIWMTPGSLTKYVCITCRSILRWTPTISILR